MSEIVESIKRKDIRETIYDSGFHNIKTEGTEQSAENRYAWSAAVATGKAYYLNRYKEIKVTLFTGGSSTAPRLANSDSVYTDLWDSSWTNLNLVVSMVTLQGGTIEQDVYGQWYTGDSGGMVYLAISKTDKVNSYLRLVVEGILK
jgi:hypothetical protein